MLNEIHIWEEDKYGIYLAYNRSQPEAQIVKIEHAYIYDLLLQLLSRETLEQKIRDHFSFLLTIEEWINEEGDFARKQLDSLREDLQHQSINHRSPFYLTLNTVP